MTSPNAQYRAIEEKREGEKRRQKESDERVSSSHSKQSQQPFPLNSSSDHVTTSVQSPFSISTALSSQSDEEYDEFHDEIGSEVSPLEKSRDEGAEGTDFCDKNMIFVIDIVIRSCISISFFFLST